MTERLGLGFSVRYSRATATVRLGTRSPTPLELGGTHAAGGLRIRVLRPSGAVAAERATFLATT